MALITIPTRTSTDLNAAADINALMDNDEYLEAEIPNAAWPVGSFYWQPPSAESNTKATAFPTAEEPGELFGGTWEQRYHDEGIFFKTEGDPLSQTDGENNVRTTGLQTDGFQGHKVQSSHSADGTSLGNYTSGNYSIPWSPNPNGTAQNVDNQSLIADSTNGTPRIGKETRPRNRLMKLWYRTA